MKDKKKIKRVKIAFKKLQKASWKLEIARYRRIQAEKGNVLGALFGKPKKKKITRRKK